MGTTCDIDDPKTMMLDGVTVSKPTLLVIGKIQVSASYSLYISFLISRFQI